MFTEHQMTIMALYKPTSLVIKLVNKICKELENRGYGFGDRFFMPKQFTIGKPALTMLSMEREDSHCQLLIHWKPDFDVSTSTDPYCSGFILRPNSLMKILNYIQKN